jgi:hypothetical protein
MASCSRVREKARRLRKGLRNIDGVTFAGHDDPVHDDSPVVHLRLRRSQGNRAADEALLRQVEAKVRSPAARAG